MEMLSVRNALTIFNFIIVAFMTLFFAYQTIYIAIGFIYKFKERKADKQNLENKVEDIKLHKYAAITSARNEEEVIPQLIESLKNQDYPKELLDIFVICDNCTDNTAKVAKEAGAYVIIRNDQINKGKGYALDYFFKTIFKCVGRDQYAGYFVFDSDNIVDKNFVKEMNITYNTKHYDAMTSYRNSKNYDDNWISAANSLYFLKEARFLNSPRSIINTNCAISGTGFFVSQNVINKNNGWPFHLLTEDIEFSVNCAIDGIKIGYCDKAMVYDEQPTLMSQSFTQRLRWSKGFYQINGKYTSRLLKGIFEGKNFACYDLLASTAPSMLLQIASVIVNIIVYLYASTLYPTIFVLQTMQLAQTFVISALINYYLLSFFVGSLTLICEWDMINASNKNKIKYLFSFPIFVMTYIPIGIVALFKKVEWKEIKHFATTRDLTLETNERMS